MIKPYRYKHIPTGLYFCLVRNVQFSVIDNKGAKHSCHQKSNLSKSGKVYFHNSPDAKGQGPKTGFYNHIRNKELIEEYLKTNNFGYGVGRAEMSSYLAAEWEVEYLS